MPSVPQDPGPRQTAPSRSARDLAAAAASHEPGPGLAAVAALRRLLEELEVLHVSDARARGWSWEAIAAALGVSRQSVHKKHARRLAGRTQHGR